MDDAMTAVGHVQAARTARRAKNRLNRSGSTICRLLRVDGTRLWVAELDAIDGTPVLDIKPVMADYWVRT
jgi:tRNA (Thr-GGU) A37 N-methylase